MQAASSSAFGKVYYDLLAARGDDASIALVRCELLYPWPESMLEALKKRYKKAKFVWCQEEPENMGSWQFVRDRFAWHGHASRRAAASPATGSLQRHKAEQAALVEDAPQEEDLAVEDLQKIGRQRAATGSVQP